MNKAVRSDRKRAVVAEAGNPTYHRKGWYEPVEAPTNSVCSRCRRQAPFLVWQSPHWLCAVCADAN
jgi:hypothetical protein